jgi:hypothetical protein
MIPVSPGQLHNRRPRAAHGTLTLTNSEDNAQFTTLVSKE